MSEFEYICADCGWEFDDPDMESFDFPACPCCGCPVEEPE